MELTVMSQWREKLRTRLRAAKEKAAPKVSAFSDWLNANVLTPLDGKTKEWKIRKQIKQALPGDLTDPMVVADLFQRTFQKGNASFYGKLATLTICMFFLADLSALLVDRYVPEPPPTRSARRSERRRSVTLEDYQAIIARNLFSSKGLIPGEETPGTQDMGGVPVRTGLPLNLVGTLILQNELRSIGTIEDRSSQMVYPVRTMDEIPSKIRVIKVEPRKVIFLNLSSGRREFVDLPEDNLAISTRIATPVTRATSPGVEKVSDTQWNISRSEVDRTLADLNNVLTQARCVPNFENGLPAGFKCFQIQKGSIYDKLGLQDNDVLVGLNGEAINDPGKAFELLNQLKTANHLELSVKRNGKQQNFAYDFH